MLAASTDNDARQGQETEENYYGLMTALSTTSREYRSRERPGRETYYLNGYCKGPGFSPSARLEKGEQTGYK